MNIRKQVTLNDIANELQLSKVAVSKALRDHPDISAETKQRVRTCAQRLGYVPNLMARNLSARRSLTIGLVVPKVAHHFFAAAIESIYKTANAHNYEVIMTVSQEKAENEARHIQSLLAMHVDGLLVSVTPDDHTPAVYEAARKRGVPLVFFDRVIENSGFSCVTTADEQGSEDIIAYLVEAGYTRIAHLAGYDTSNIGRNRCFGFRKSAARFGLDVPDDWIIPGGFDEQSGYHSMQRLIKVGKFPQVVYAVTYPVALGAMQAAGEGGLRIPEDVDIISFGGSDYNRFICPSISYLEQPVTEIGRQAVQVLLNEINHPQAEVSDIKIPAKLILCETCLKKNGLTKND